MTKSEMKLFDKPSSHSKDAMRCCINTFREFGLLEKQVVYQNVVAQQLKRDKVSLKRRSFKKNSESPLTQLLHPNLVFNSTGKTWEEKTRQDSCTLYAITESRNDRFTYIEQPIFIRRPNNAYGAPKENLIKFVQNYCRTAQQTQRLSNELPKKEYARKYTERNSAYNVQSLPTFLANVTNDSPKITKKINGLVSRQALESSSSIAKKKINIKKSQNQHNQQPCQNITVNSIFGDSLVHEQRISESTIEIDFFNPSQARLGNLENELKRQNSRAKNVL